MGCFSRWTLFTILLFKQYLLRLVNVFQCLYIYIFSLQLPSQYIENSSYHAGNSRVCIMVLF